MPSSCSSRPCSGATSRTPQATSIVSFPSKSPHSIEKEVQTPIPAASSLPKHIHIQGEATMAIKTHQCWKFWPHITIVSKPRRHPATPFGLTAPIGISTAIISWLALGAQSPNWNTRYRRRRSISGSWKATWATPGASCGKSPIEYDKAHKLSKLKIRWMQNGNRERKRRGRPARLM